MLTNDILRRVRFATDLSDPKVLSLMAVGGRTVTRDALHDYLKKETDEGMQLCPDDVLAAFLNGLIIERRGVRPTASGAEQTDSQPETLIDNNIVLKKLRVAFSLRDADVQALLSGSGLKLSRSELNALFRHPSHKNFKACGDQILRHILSGLTHKYRPDQTG